ncbi:unnamed protein product, partial [Ectocarpus sp. 12 AP-2014]
VYKAKCRTVSSATTHQSFNDSLLCRRQPAGPKGGDSSRCGYRSTRCLFYCTFVSFFFCAGSNQKDDVETEPTTKKGKRAEPQHQVRLDSFQSNHSTSSLILDSHTKIE